MVWIAQGVDFSTPCRQRLIPFKPLTNRQKYKTLGSSTLLRKAAFGVPVFFGVQGSSTLLRKAAFGVPVFFGVQGSSTLLRKAAFGVPVFFGVQGSSTLLCKAACGVPVFFGAQNIHRLKALKLRIFPCGFQLGNPTPQDMRAAFYG